MANQSTIRFDHREIAVIFSLFVFVSLLMFTVGILVGKGLSQNLQSAGADAADNLHSSPLAEHHTESHNAHSTGTSVSTDRPSAAEHGHAAAEAPEASEDKNEHAAAAHPHETKHASEASHDTHDPASHEEADHGGPPSEAVEDAEPLKLVPEKPKITDARGSLHDLPKTHEVEAALKNPKLQAIYEGGKPTNRDIASVPSKTGALAGSVKGAYTIQIASYPTKKEAIERVDALKKLGFPYAYYSAKDPNSKNSWFRVWLGHFPDVDTAQKSGEHLQARGEVKTYLVRRSDSKD